MYSLADQQTPRRKPGRPRLDFWARVLRHARVENGCLVWVGTISHYGYGILIVRENGHSYRRYVHRLVWEHFNGPVPAQTLDHLCRNRACFYPGHLEPVSSRENSLRGVGPSAQNARKTHCPRGHEYDQTEARPNGRCARICGQCRSARRRHNRLVRLGRAPKGQA